MIACALEGGDTITWTLGRAIPAYSAFQVKMAEGFNNPLSTEPTATFQMAVYTDGTKSTRLDYQDVDLTYTAAVAHLHSEKARLIQLDAASAGTGEVGKPTKVRLELLLGIGMPSGTVVTLDLPKHNPEASNSRRRSYFLDPSASPTTPGSSAVPKSVNCKPFTHGDGEAVDAGVTCTVTERGRDSNGQLFD